MAQNAILPHKNDGDPDDLRLLLSYYLIDALADASDSPLPIEAGDSLTVHILGDGPRESNVHLLRVLRDADDPSFDSFETVTVDYAWHELHEVKWPAKARTGRVWRRRDDLTDATAATWTPGTPSVPLSDPSWKWPRIANPDYGNPGEPEWIPWIDHPDFDVTDIQWHVSFPIPYDAAKDGLYNYTSVTPQLGGTPCYENDELCNVWLDRYKDDPDGPWIYRQVTWARWFMSGGAGTPSFEYAWEVAYRTIASPADHDPWTAPSDPAAWTIMEPSDIGDYTEAEPTIEARVASHFLAHLGWYETTAEVEKPTDRAFLGITEENVNGLVVKRYANGSSTPDGTIPARRVTLDPPPFTWTERTAWYSIPGSMPAFENQFYADVGFGFYERELGLLPTGVLPANLNETTGSGTTVPWGTVEAFIDPTEEREWTITLGVFAAANDNQVEAGIGYLREFYTAGVKTLDVVDPIYTDFMPLSRWNAADGREPPSAIVPNQPPIAMPAGGMPSWLDYNDWNERPCVFWPAGDARLQFHAILSDDGDCHDPRANTADASLRAYLQAGSGLIYDGPYGQLPRPYSGATGIMLGRELTLAGGYSFDVVTTPRVGELMAALLDDAGQLLVWTAREVEGEWVATPAWNAPIADALPASVQAELAGAEPPQLTYRFVLPDWPHPTGVLSIGGTHTIFAARHRRNDRKYRTPGRPPIVTTFGWRDD